MPEFCHIFDVKKVEIEGWLSGMFETLINRNDCEIACCFPIIDNSRLKKGRSGRLQFFSFHYSMDVDNDANGYITEFEMIYEEFKPDIIHIWGTEFNHSYVAIQAAKNMNMDNKTIIHIQGLVSAIAPYYNFGVPDSWLDKTCNGKKSMLDEQHDFFRRGENEIKALLNANYIMGRTKWDYAYYMYINAKGSYIYCGEMLRKVFYNSKLFWDIKKCKKHSIFISQASYALKGLHLLIPAISWLKKMYFDIQVYVAGYSGLFHEMIEKETPYDRYLKNQINQYDLNGVINFLGMLSPQEMIDQYLNAHVYVNCSTIENSSNSIGEAQYLGTPVVASYTGGTPDLVEDGKTGFLYQMDSPYMFIATVCKLFDDDQLAQSISEQEKTVALDRYNPKTIYQQLISVYKTVSS